MKRETTTKTKKKSVSKKETVNEPTSMQFICYCECSPVADEELCDKFTINKGISTLTYDEVEDAAINCMLKKYPDEYYPASSITRITVLDEDGKECPVASESEKDIRQKYPKKKVLVLPRAYYALTDEMLLWMALKDEGYVSSEDKMDMDSMRRILKQIKDYHAKLEAGVK